MSNLQHDRISELCRELRLGAMADLYGPIAQNAAKKKDVSYSDFLEEVLRAEREAKRCRAREMLTRVGAAHSSCRSYCGESRSISRPISDICHTELRTRLTVIGAGV